METILKYKNRKLYSKKLKKYVPKKYLTELVLNDEVFTVIDNKDKSDITLKSVQSLLADESNLTNLDAIVVRVKELYSVN